MDPSQDDPNRQLVPLQTPPSSGGFMDYIKRNKLLVAIVIIIIVGLIWWFCIKKNKLTDATPSGTGTSVTATNTGVKVSKIRTGNSNALY